MPSQQSMSDLLVVVTVVICAFFLATAGTKGSIYVKTPGTAARTVTTIDPNTGLKFEPTRDFLISRKMQLLGVGTRKKAILNIYSVGVYASKSIVTQWQSEKLPKNGLKRCQTAIVDSRSPRAVQLKFSMGVGAEKIVEAVSGIPGVSPKTRQEFEEMIIKGIGGKLLKNEEMAFEWKGLDQITVSVRGKLIGTVKNKTLARGVLSLYVGQKSVSPSLLQDLHCR
jgi:hypothetical protein